MKDTESKACSGEQHGRARGAQGRFLAAATSSERRTSSFDEAVPDSSSPAPDHPPPSFAESYERLRANTRRILGE